MYFLKIKSNILYDALETFIELGSPNLFYLTHFDNYIISFYYFKPIQILYGLEIITSEFEEA